MRLKLGNAGGGLDNERICGREMQEIGNESGRFWDGNGRVSYYLVGVMD